MADKATLISDLTTMFEDTTQGITAAEKAKIMGNIIHNYCMSLKVKAGISVSGATTGGYTLLEAATDGEGGLE